MDAITTSRAFILPYGGGMTCSGNKFINFDQTGSVIIGVASVQGTTEDDNGGFSYHFDQCQYVNSPNKVICP